MHHERILFNYCCPLSAELKFLNNKQCFYLTIVSRIQSQCIEDRPTNSVRGSASVLCHAGNPLFYNNVVELPMALDIIGSRLQNGYYRNVKAVANDANLIKSNAKRFNGAQSRIGRDANGKPLVFMFSSRMVLDVLTICLMLAAWSQKLILRFVDTCTIKQSANREVNLTRSYRARWPIHRIKKHHPPPPSPPNNTPKKVFMNIIKV